jgi:hypothetical protein
MNPAPKNLRVEMPQTYAFIEACRAAFGAENVNPMIKLGIAGALTFHATENGIEVGTRFSEPIKFVVGDSMLIRADVGEVMAMVKNR